MPRPNISNAMLAALVARDLKLAIFVEATFASGPVYLWSGFGPIAWNGRTWLGLGSLGKVSPIAEGTTVESRGITLTLSGIDPTLLSSVLGEFLLAAPALVYLGLFTAGALIASPLTIWAGRMDKPSIKIGAETATININCESRLVDMNTSVERRYTADDQQRDWPGDLGMTFVNSIQEMTLYWGTAPTTSGTI